MSEFVARDRELALLDKQLTKVERGDLPGKALLLRGRRRVGKSRLVEVFCERTKLPSVTFQASRGEPAATERAEFAQAVCGSTLPRRDLFRDLQFESWRGVWSRLAEALPDDTASIVVIDELPWLLEQDSTAEGALQTVWDRALSRKPVLLILIGSDVATMEHIAHYGRPFHQRAAEMVLRPLSPRGVGELLALDPADAFDAALITGGLPLICQEWSPGQTRSEFLAAALEDPTSALLVSGERTLAAEFPHSVQTRHVLAIIGSGERTFSSIAAAAGGGGSPLPAGSLSPVLQALVDYGLVAAETALSTKATTRDRRYRVTDSYLRFWFSFLGPRGIAEVDSGRGSIVASAIERSWTSWRGRAIESLIRDSLMRLLPDEQFPHATTIGGWWNRANNPELDVVAADRQPAKTVSFVGSIKWLENSPFDARDFQTLARDAAAVPGVDAETALVAISRSGATTSAPSRVFGPAELLEAW